MKSVLISIQPKWCEKIAIGEKTVEIRKTKPKLNTPFRVYIYCTKESYKGKYLHTSNKSGPLLGWKNPNDCNITVQPENYTYKAYSCRGKVIGEFVCDSIDEYYQEEWTSPYYDISDDDLHSSCLHCEDMYKYGNGKTLYGWHISDLVIYDKPKELSEFYKKLTFDEFMDEKTDTVVNFNGVHYKPLTRPPQSWCYVEELST